MTRTPSHRPRPPRAKPTTAFAWTGTPTCSPGETRGWTIVALGLIGAFALGVIAMILGPHRIGDYFTESDFYGAYADGARLILHGHFVPARYTVIGPGYEVALAIVGIVIRDLFRAAEWLSLASAVFVVWTWQRLLARRVDARLGAAAVLFLVTNEGLFRYAYSATTDAFGIALQSAAMLALLGGPGGNAAPSTTRGSRRIVAAGLLCAFAFLTRYNAIALVPAAWLALLAGGVRVERRGRAVLVFTLAFMAPVVPWLLYSLAHGGTLGTQLHHNIAYEVYARSRGIAWDDYQKNLQSQFPNLGAVIARDPGAVASRMTANVFEHLRDDAERLLGWPVALAAALGFLLMLRGRWWSALWPVFAAMALLFLTLVPVFYSERYSLALLPGYATLAGVALASPLAALAVGRRQRVWLKALAIPVIVALLAPAWRAHEARTIDQLPLEVLDAGRALRALRQPGDKVICRKAHIGFYGDCLPIGFPFADSLADLGRYARATRARWLYMSWPEAETRPRFWYLLDTSAVVPGLRVAYASRGRPAVVYEIGPELGATPTWMANDTLFTLHTLRARTRVDTADPRLLEQLGSVAWVLGRLPEARAALRQAVALDPGSGRAYELLGRVDLALDDYAGARDAYARALEIDSGNASARVSYGLASFLLGRDREAADAWRPVIPMTVDLKVLRAMEQLFDSLGDDAAAREARDRLVALVSDRS